MKKFLAFLLVMILAFSLAACGGKEEEEASFGGSAESSKQEVQEPEEEKDEDRIDAEDVVEKALEEAEELNSFSVEAVEHYLKAYDIALSDLEPEWEWVLANEYCAYADDPSDGYGHAAVKFNRAEGELTDEEINDYFTTVFEVTAAVSDDGYNIIGYEFVGDGEDALAETTLEDAMNGFMQGWGFRRDGKFMVVYVSSDYDNDKESELDRLFYYNAVEFDIGVGLQKSFDESWDEMEEYFEENEDEIKEALEDYAN